MHDHEFFHRVTDLLVRAEEVANAVVRRVSGIREPRDVDGRQVSGRDIIGEMEQVTAQGELLQRLHTELTRSGWRAARSAMEGEATRLAKRVEEGAVLLERVMQAQETENERQ